MVTTPFTPSRGQQANEDQKTRWGEWKVGCLEKVNQKYSPKLWAMMVMNPMVKSVKNPPTEQIQVFSVLVCEMLLLVEFLFSLSTKHTKNQKRKARTKKGVGHQESSHEPHQALRFFLNGLGIIPRRWNSMVTFWGDSKNSPKRTASLPLQIGGI